MTAAEGGREVDPVAGPTPAVDVAALLGSSRAAVEPALRAAVDRLDPASRAHAAYHLGWTDLDGRPARGGGKAVRPALALLAARLTGGPEAEAAAVPGAAALELVHNFSLVHDDLMDGDVERRHRRTVWARWGPAAAILTGDGMLAVALEILLDSPSPHAPAAARDLAAAVRELVAGQADDVAFEHRDDVTVAECLAMAERKTSALLAASTRLGARLAGARDDVVEALGRFGAELGTAFQLRDDLLGIWGDPRVTGKAVLADLRARKKSLPVTWAVRHGGPAGRELAAWLATPPGDDTELALRRAAALVERGGGRAWAAAEAGRRLAAAEAALATTGNTSENTHGADAGRAGASARAELLALGRFLADREA